MKIYTKTGDQGTTGLLGGRRVSKAAPRIDAYGQVDELNALLGFVAAQVACPGPIAQAIKEVQVSLFSLGAQLASPSGDPKIEVITSRHVDALERQMDAISQNLSPLKNFILPGGGTVSASLHLARTVCRRAERAVVHLTQVPGESVDRWVVIYINRLSDFLFILARLANQLAGVDDTPWLPEKK